MLGAVAGDIIGSCYERHFNRVKVKDFELFRPDSRFTDDSVMTLAVARWLLDDPGHSHETLIRSMLDLGRRYPYAGYGGRFVRWLSVDNPSPIGSFGNGSAMRVSPVGLYARTLDEALRLAKVSAEVSHDHPEGIRGAQVVAGCVFLSRQGKAKRDIRDFAIDMGYDMSRTVDEIRPGYGFDATCQGSVPEAIQCFLEGRDLEDTIRLAVSLGGDSDTQAAIAASIYCANPGAERQGEIFDRCRALLTPDLLEIMDRFEASVVPVVAAESVLADRIRGSVVGGAAGDALGYAVEFQPWAAIRQRYGDRGIVRYETDSRAGKAVFSDDTQMTLFTAFGLLRACSAPEPDYVGAVKAAYLEWLQTQTGDQSGPRSLWITGLPPLNVPRAPGNTCLDALRSLASGAEVRNHSKGCGGVMRVAPVGLLAASRGWSSASRVAGECARLTHQHPLGFLPAAVLAELVRRIVLRQGTVDRQAFGRLVVEALDDMDAAYRNRFDAERLALRELSVKALALAETDLADVDAIGRLGEGWVGEEALAIALYCVARHITDFRGTLVAAVNHGGDSDSTGAIAGNIIGAVLGYGAIPADYAEGLQLTWLLDATADILIGAE